MPAVVSNWGAGSGMFSALPITIMPLSGKKIREPAVLCHGWFRKVVTQTEVQASDWEATRMSKSWKKETVRRVVEIVLRDPTPTCGSVHSNT